MENTDKKEYETPVIEEHAMETPVILAESQVETEEKEFKGHTDNYDEKFVGWDTITFD